jgi:hypothetical protein
LISVCFRKFLANHSEIDLTYVRITSMEQHESNPEQKSKEYSLPLEEYSYIGRYPPDLRFEKPWEVCIQVGQGSGKRSNDGKPLQSEGFSKCTALIIQNADTQEAELFHIDDIDLSHTQSELLYKLSDGNYIGRFVRGSLSREVSERIGQSNYFKKPFSDSRRINMAEDFVVNTGNKHWAIVYDPKSHSVSVQSKELGKVLFFKV